MPSDSGRAPSSPYPLAARPSTSARHQLHRATGKTGRANLVTPQTRTGRGANAPGGIGSRAIHSAFSDEQNSGSSAHPLDRRLANTTFRQSRSGDRRTTLVFG